MIESDNEFLVNKFEIIFNKGIILAVLLVSSFSILFGGCLAFYFSDSIFTIFFSLVIGVTIGVMLNYFLLSSKKLVKKINVELAYGDNLDETTMMKIEE
jgi:hypothetical protein